MSLLKRMPSVRSINFVLQVAGCGKGSERCPMEGEDSTPEIFRVFAAYVVRMLGLKSTPEASILRTHVYGLTKCGGSLYA